MTRLSKPSPPSTKIVNDGSGGRLVDDTEDLETGNGTSILGGLTLSVVEVRGNGDDGAGDFLSKVSLSGLLDLGQNNAETSSGVKFLLSPHCLVETAGFPFFKTILNGLQETN
jgi:NAD-specific glutamate dehydrogenase